MEEFFRDYGALIAPAAAVINGFIAVLISQFFKDSPRAKVILVISAGILGACAISATFYTQHQIVAEREATLQRNKKIRDQLGNLIQEGSALIAGCGNPNNQAPTTQADAWLNKVEAFLNNQLGHSYAQRLITPVPNVITLSCNNANDGYNKLFRIILGVNTHLEEFSQQAAF